MAIQVNLFITDIEYNQTPSKWDADTFNTGKRKELATACKSIAEQCWIRPFNEYYQQAPDLFKNFYINAAPAIVFYDTVSQSAVAALKGSQITKENILLVYNKLSGTGGGGTQNGGNDSEWGYLPFGFPSDKDPRNLPALMMVLSTIGFTKALDNKAPIKQRLAFGIGAGIAGYFTLQRLKSVLWEQGKTPSWNPIANIVEVAKNISSVQNYHSLFLIPATFLATKAAMPETSKTIRPVLAVGSAAITSVYLSKEFKKNNIGVNGLPVGKGNK